jgi:Spy/CpxP family protein refolding chaperone
MKTNHVYVKLIMLAMMFVVIVTGIFAQTGSTAQSTEKSLQGSVQSSPPSPSSPPPPPPPQQLESLEDAPPPGFILPDLTDDQKARIKKADLKQMEAMTPLRNQMREKKTRLMTILTTMPVNLKDADQVADEIGKLEAAILKQQVRHDQELRAILTPDQQIIFDSKPKPFLNKRNQLPRTIPQRNH